MHDVVTYPLLLTPRYLTKPWGGRRMETLLRRALPDAGGSHGSDDAGGTQPFGESWEVFDRGGASSVIRNGPLAGKTLADLRGNAPFPLLVKILDAAERLSVQVHPDAETAARLGGGAEAKTECWFVLHAEPGARVWRGLAEGVTRADIQRCTTERGTAEGTLESLLHSFEVEAGDTIYIPAGMVHTIGAGVLLAEVQQNSDTTYRLHDWGRGRDIHVREALESIRFGPRTPDKIPPQPIADDGALERVLRIRCPFFAVEALTGMGTFTLEAPPLPGSIPPVLHFVSGSGELRPFRRGVAPVHFVPGDTLLLPPRDEEFEIVPGTTVVRAFLIR